MKKIYKIKGQEFSMQYDIGTEEKVYWGHQFIKLNKGDTVIVEIKRKKRIKERCDGCGEIRKIVYSENDELGMVYLCKKCYIPKRKHNEKTNI